MASSCRVCVLWGEKRAGRKEGAAVKALRAEISWQREPDHNGAIGGNAMLLAVQCQGFFFFAEARLHVLRECPKEIVAEFQVATM